MCGRTIFNGNGKQPWELRLAVENNVLINIDSEFDLENILAAAQAGPQPARVLIRINPDVDPQVCCSPVLLPEQVPACLCSTTAEPSDCWLPLNGRAHLWELL